MNVDSKKQLAIRHKFKEVLEEQSLYGHPYRTDNLWVIYGGFEPIARIEANDAVSEEEIEQLKTELDNKDLWLIRTAFSGVTFFLYTDEQLKQYENSAIKKQWAEKYFDLLERYNQFGYFKRESFNIYLDSKEKFDKNYASNWYYYYK